MSPRTKFMWCWGPNLRLPRCQESIPPIEPHNASTPRQETREDFYFLAQNTVWERQGPVQAWLVNYMGSSASFSLAGTLMTVPRLVLA